METLYLGSQEVEVLQINPTLVQINGEKGSYWVRREQLSTTPSCAKKSKRPRTRVWENAEKRASVLKRLVGNPSAYIVAAWLLNNNAHVHLSLSPSEHENGGLESLVDSEISEIQDSDISVATDLTQGSTFTAIVSGVRPTDEVLKAFSDIDVTPSLYYGTGTTVQKWGFVYDFFMVELGIGFNHNTDLQAVVNRISNEKCREVFVREINGN